MEDRITPRIYLEMSDASPDVYRDRRAAELLACDGAQRVTWWANCHHSRTDLPRRLPEFRTLGLVEGDATLSPPAPPDAARGHLFELTPRPGQGILGVRPTRGLELVLISPKTPGGAQALRDWGDFVHIRDIAAAAPPHFKMITPYVNARADEPRFMHLYELDTDDPEPAFKEMTPATRRWAEAFGGHSWEEWSGHPELVIEYVNTFRWLGERA